MVQTPWILAQAQNHFNTFNPLYGSGVDFTTANVPVNNWTVFFRPFQVVFFILPLEYAFAWMWYSRAFVLMIVLYFGLLKITHNLFTSILLSLSFCFSAFIQWWYATPAIEVVTFGCLIAIMLVNYLKADHIKNAIFHYFLFIYFSCCFVIHLYPPFQIPVALSLAFILLGYWITGFQKKIL
ncbi:MAG: hypothetical protein LWX83_19785, partial [Anaerolineae bacterium]|nr:hypothetical protein [Anaerolineae bacterium]